MKTKSPIQNGITYANEKPAFYDNLFDDLVRQTPKEVWEQYLKDGYTLREAIKEERSQA